MTNARQEAVVRLGLQTQEHDAAAAKSAAALRAIGAAGEASSRQVAAAMRSLPAQFTDVATQLAGGANPLLVLLQQGGQVRDQFGSLRGAVQGIASALPPARLALLGTAAAAAALGVAYAAAGREQDAIVRGLVLTGGAAGVTADQINELARAQASLAGTRGQAAEVLTSLASAGTVAASQLAITTEAAIRLERAGGPAVAETVKKFVDLGRDPINAVARLNREENFLTESLFRQIVALDARGLRQEAAALAQEAYAKSTISRAEEIETQLSNLQKFWRGVTDAAKEAWDAMIGRPATLQQQLDSAIAQLEAAGDEPRRGGSSLQGEARRQAIRQRIADLRQQIYELGEVAAASEAAARRVRRVVDDEPARRLAAARAAALRERAFDRTPPLAGLDYRDRSDRLVPAATPDPLGEFINERVLPADRERQERRLAQQQQFLAELVGANAQANLALIADDRQRALAQIALERQQLQARIEAIFESGPDRAAAERQADEAAAARMQAVGAQFARETGLVTREETRNALAAAFRDTKNPIRAFGDALGNIVFTRVSEGLADALVTAAIGPAGGVGGGLFGSLLDGLGSFFGIGGGRASGGPVRRGSMHEVLEDGAGELLRTRSGRSYLLAGEDGEVVPLPRRGGTASRGGAGGVGPMVQVFQTNHLGSNVTRAEVAEQMVISQRATQAAVIDALRRNRLGI